MADIGYTFIQSTTFTQSKMAETYPELEALAGPLKGNSFPLSEPEISIGREPSNQMPILDASVSRRHCLIRREADGFKIQDLKSRNSTFVNGVPVTEKILVSGDEIKIGNSLFVFVKPDAEGKTAPSVEFDKDDTGGGSTDHPTHAGRALFAGPGQNHSYRPYGKGPERAAADQQGGQFGARAGGAGAPDSGMHFRSGARRPCRHPAVRPGPGGMQLRVRMGSPHRSQSGRASEPHYCRSSASGGRGAAVQRSSRGPGIFTTLPAC